jgi:hypothetical protein
MFCGECGAKRKIEAEFPEPSVFSAVPPAAVTESVVAAVPEAAATPEPPPALPNSEVATPEPPPVVAAVTTPQISADFGGGESLNVLGSSSQPSSEMTVIAPKKSRKGRIILAIAGSFVGLLIAAGVVGYNFYYNSWVMNRAMNNLEETLAERIDSTPMMAFLTLAEAMQNGSVSADFEFAMPNDDPFLGSLLGFTVNGNVSMFADSERGNYAVTANASTSVLGQDIDANAAIYANRDRVMVGSNLLNQYYGFNFNDFSTQLDPLAERMELDPDAIKMISDMMEYIRGQFGNTVDFEAWLEPYNDLVREHIRKNEDSSERRVEVRVGRSDTVNARKITYSFDLDSIVDLLWDIFDMLEADSVISGIFDGIPESFSDLSDDNHDFMKLLEEAIFDFDEFTNNFDLTMSFYLSGSRFVQIEAEFEIDYMREVWDWDNTTWESTSRRERTRERGSITLNLGTEADSDWVLTVTEGRNVVATMEWRVNTGSRVRHELVVAQRGCWQCQQDVANADDMNIRNCNGHTVLDWSWFTSDGSFTLTIGDEYYSQTFEGTYKTWDGGFELGLDIEGVKLKIVAEVGGSVPVPTSEDFVSLTDIDAIIEDFRNFAMLETLLDFFGMGGWGQDDDPSSDFPPWDGPWTPPPHDCDDCDGCEDCEECDECDDCDECTGCDE